MGKAKAIVLLRFKNAAHKKRFLSQLSDGWGENWVSLDWDYTAVSLAEAEVVDVTLSPDEVKEMRRHAALKRKFLGKVKP
jgi:hypothetical protein